MIIESDLKLVVDGVVYGHDLCDYFDTILDQCIFLREPLGSVEIQFIRRTTNACAHTLASLALNNCLDRFWVNEAPLCIFALFAANCVSCA